eukprot:5962653-Pyramimonas_sp.AAC.1
MNRGRARRYRWIVAAAPRRPTYALRSSAPRQAAWIRDAASTWAGESVTQASREALQSRHTSGARAAH